MTRLLTWLFSRTHCTRFVQLQQRHAARIICFSLLLLCLSLFINSRLRIDSNIISLLPPDTPSVLQLKRIVAKTGGLGDLMVMLEGDHIQAEAYAAQLLPRIQALPWVAHAYYRVDTSVFSKNRLLYLSLDELGQVEQRLTRYLRSLRRYYGPLALGLEDSAPPQPDFSDIIQRHAARLPARSLNTDAARKRLILVVYPKGVTSDIAYARRIYTQLKHLVEPAGPSPLHITVGGTFKNRLNEYDTVIDDLTSGALLAGLCIALFLLLSFRNGWALLLLLLPLLVGLSLTFSLAWCTLGALNLMSAFLIVVLAGLGIDFGIHLLARYHTVRETNHSPAAALSETLHHTGRACLTAALTTAAAFFALTISNFRGFRHFGLIAGCGIMLTVIAYFILLPALLLVLEQYGFSCSPYRVHLLRRQQPAAAMPTPTGRPPLYLAAFLLLLILCGALLPQLSFESDFRNVRVQLPSMLDFNRRMRTVFTLPRDPAAFMVADTAQARRVTNYLRTHKPSSVSHIASLADVLPSQQTEKLALIASIRRRVARYKKLLPQHSSDQWQHVLSWLDAVPIGPAQLPPAVQRSFIGDAELEGQLVYLFQRHTMLDMHFAEQFAAQVRHLSTPDGTFSPVSEPIVYVDVMTMLKRDALLAMALSALAILLWLVSDLGSFKGAMLTAAPLAAGILCMLGIMAAWGIKLNIFNIVVLPSIIGLGVDAGVHMYHRLQAEGRHQLARAVLSSTHASGISTMTTLIGFAGLLIARHPGLRSVGMIAIIGMSTCLLMAVTLLPLMWSKAHR